MNGKISTTGFDFVMYLVRDMAKARTFYEGLFDLKPGQFDRDNFVEYDLSDGNTFALAVAPGGDFAQCGGAMFAVPDIEQGAQRVKDLGGTFFISFSGQVCTSAWCADPDGNRFGLHKRKG